VTTHLEKKPGNVREVGEQSEKILSEQKLASHKPYITRNYSLWQTFMSLSV